MRTLIPLVCCLLATTEALGQQSEEVDLAPRAAKSGTGLLIAGPILFASGTVTLASGLYYFDQIHRAWDFTGGAIGIALIAGGGLAMIVGLVLTIVGCVKHHRSRDDEEFIPSTDEPRLLAPAPRPLPIPMLLVPLAQL